MTEPIAFIVKIDFLTFDPISPLNEYEGSVDFHDICMRVLMFVCVWIEKKKKLKIEHLPDEKKNIE